MSYLTKWDALITNKNMTKIIYQWVAGAYMHQAALSIEKDLNVSVKNMQGYDSFEECWSNYDKDDIMVLAIENSYAGSIYENLYKFLKHDVKIIWEYNMEINHCLCSKENNINQIKKVYSHFKALPQCYEYLKEKNIIEQEVYPDTAWAALMLSQSEEKWAAAICSKLAWEMYGLNILDENIQDQKGNTTRFIVIVPKESKITYWKGAWKVSILFAAKDIPSSLYKCLGAFATNWVNLSKIESLPDIRTPFSYLFWLDFEGKLSDTSVQKSLTELEFFTTQLQILGEY